MAKFIIEIDDDVIRENGNPKNCFGEIKENDSAGHALRALYNSIAFKSISVKLDEGITEFHVTPDMMKGDTRRTFYDNNIADVCMLAFMAMDEKDDKKEG